jgi:hypothetical protein
VRSARVVDAPDGALSLTEEDDASRLPASRWPRRVNESPRSCCARLGLRPNGGAAPPSGSEATVSAGDAAADADADARPSRLPFRLNLDVEIARRRSEKRLVCLGSGGASSSVEEVYSTQRTMSARHSLDHRRFHFTGKAMRASVGARFAAAGTDLICRNAE